MVIPGEFDMNDENEIRDAETPVTESVPESEPARSESEAVTDVVESEVAEAATVDAVEAHANESIGEDADGAPSSAGESVSEAEVLPVPDETQAKKKKPAKVKPVTDDADEEPEASPSSAEAEAPVATENKKHWYVIKVTSNREESIKSAIERRVKIEGLEEYFGQIVIPVERITQVKKVTEKKKDTGEKVTKERRVTKENKKYPGYLFAEVEFNDRILYLFRETSGVGDFVGASLNRAPTPMTDKEVLAMLTGFVDPKDAKKASKTVVKLDFEKGDKVRVREGAFANSEGEVKMITDPKDTGDTPKVTVVVTIWGRPVDVELDYWQVDKI